MAGKGESSEAGCCAPKEYAFRLKPFSRHLVSVKHGCGWLRTGRGYSKSFLAEAERVPWPLTFTSMETRRRCA